MRSGNGTTLEQQNTQGVTASRGGDAQHEEGSSKGERVEDNHISKPCHHRETKVIGGAPKCRKLERII